MVGIIQLHELYTKKGYEGTVIFLGEAKKYDNLKDAHNQTVSAIHVYNRIVTQTTVIDKEGKIITIWTCM